LLAHKEKRKREPLRLPQGKKFTQLLERESQAKLQLPHCSTVFNVLAQTGISTYAVNATVARGRAEAIHRVIKHIKGIHPESSPHAFGDVKVPHYRKVRAEER